MQPSRSLHRRRVDKLLADEGTTLAEVVSQGQAAGKPIEDIWMELRGRIDITFSLRTLYRWMEEFEEVAS